MEQVATAVRTFNAETQLENWGADAGVADLLEAAGGASCQGVEGRVAGGVHAVPGHVRAARASTAVACVASESDVKTPMRLMLKDPGYHSETTVSRRSLARGTSDRRHREIGASAKRSVGARGARR